MTYKFVITIALLILVLIFAVQNAAIVEIKILFWQVALPRSLLIFMMLIIGIVIGWFTRSIYRLSKNRS